MAGSRRAVLVRGPEWATQSSGCGGRPTGSISPRGPTPRLSVDDADCFFLQGPSATPDGERGGGEEGF